jgi:membrane complex biogenesis BtpA family protein
MKALPKKFLATMIAVLPLPGSPRYDGNDDRIVRQALSDARHYSDAAVDALLLENSHDLPYIKPPLPTRAIEVMTRVAGAVRNYFSGPIGIQMLEAANETALDIAQRARLDFLRVESFVFGHVGGAGWIDGCAGKLLRRRKDLQCEHIRVFGDVKKKHCSHAATADLDIVDEVKQAEFFLVDGVIVTGPRTGEAPSPADLRKVKRAATVPVVIGSGMTAENIRQYYPLADGFIVGSTFREGGRYLAMLDPERLRKFMRAFHAA